MNKDEKREDINEEIEDVLEPEDTNDVYRADLLLLKRRTIAWTESHPRWKFFNRLMYAVGIIGIAVTVLVYMRGYGSGNIWKQLPLHLSLWGTALLMYLTARHGFKQCKPPFKSLVNARYEMAEEGIYYIYQYKMNEYKYYIKDENIEEMIYDDEVHTLYIKGGASLDRKGYRGPEDVGFQKVDEFYSIVPLDEYDTEDMLAPYSEICEYAPGTLRVKFIETGMDKMPKY